jgi:Putative lumazine-binding
MLIPMIMMSMFLSADEPATDDGPRAAIELYFEAHAFGDGQFIKQAFAPDAKISFIDGDQQKSWTTEEFAKRFHSLRPTNTVAYAK